MLIQIRLEHFVIIFSIVIVTSIFLLMRQNRVLKTKALLTLLPYMDTKDQATYSHCVNTGALATLFALHLGAIRKQQAETFEEIAKLHDIGKLSIPDTILHKPGKLTADEYEIVKKHPLSSEKMLFNFLGSSPFFSVILHHHEKIDGTGYPFGLQGEQIPYLARMMAIVDSFIALSTKRIYRNALELKEVFQLLKQDAGSHFDIKLLDRFLDWIDIYPILAHYFKVTLNYTDELQIYFLHCNRQKKELLILVEIKDETYQVQMHYRSYNWQVEWVGQADEAEQPELLQRSM